MNDIPSENACDLLQPNGTSQFRVSSLASGFDYDFVDKLDSKYECSICLLVLRSPIQTICGHRFCHDCIISCINGCNKECPIDKQPLSESGLFNDSCIEREILHLKVKCPNASLGCCIHVELRYIEDHIHACTYQPVLCPNECSVTVLHKELDDHLVSHCLHRLGQCKYCKKTFTYDQEQLHLAECPMVIISCDLCGKEMPRSHVVDHQKQSCPFTEVSCKFVEHGCYYRANRNEMECHSQQVVDYHMQLLSAAYKKINTLVLDLYRNIGQVASGNFIRQPSLRSQLSQSSLAEDQTSHLERTTESTPPGAQGGAGEYSPIGCTLCGPERKQDWNSDKEMRMAQQTMLETPSKGDLKDCGNVKSSKCSPPILSPMDQENLLRTLSDKYLEMNQRILADSIKMERLIKKVDFLEYNLGNISALATTNYSGTFIWKIRRFSETCIEMEKKNKFLHSPPFYTSHFGYKFCLRTNLNVVDGESFLTLYIHSMQGDYDDFLSWPFLGNISFALLDYQESQNKYHMVENIQVEEPFDAFKKPQTTRNVKGYGYKEFIPLSRIFKPTSYCNYLKDDVLCFKSVVKSK